MQYYRSDVLHHVVHQSACQRRSRRRDATEEEATPMTAERGMDRLNQHPKTGPDTGSGADTWDASGKSHSLRIVYRDNASPQKEMHACLTANRDARLRRRLLGGICIHPHARVWKQSDFQVDGVSG